MRHYRIILMILPLMVSSCLHATNYYISSSTGNDGNNGLSAGSAWKTIAKINGMNLNPGDTVLFKKGDIWRESLKVPSSGSAENYIVFTSYGNGDKPKIYGSDKASTWVNSGGNVWHSEATFTDPYASTFTAAEIFFEASDGTVTWGAHKNDIASLAAEYDWTWSGNSIYVYAGSDPGTRYFSVEVPQRDKAVNIGNQNEYIEIDGFDIRYSKNQNITDDDPETSLTGITVKNCHLSYVGSRLVVQGYNLAICRNNILIQNNLIHDGGRRCISIHVYDADNLTFKNILIEGNTCHDGYHGTGVGIAMDGSRHGNRFQDIIIRNNLFYDPPERNLPVEGFDPSSFCALRAGEPGSSIENVEIYNNIFKFPTTYATAIYNIDNVKVYNNTFFDFNKHCPRGAGYNLFHIDIANESTKVDIKNNIFYGTGDYDYLGSQNSILVQSSQTISEVYLDYNLFYEKDARLGMIDLGGNTYYRTTGTKPWSDVKTDLGWQTHDPGLLDPMFVSDTDYHLKEGSPAIGAGVKVNLISDFEGKFYNDPPSIGAYEANPKEKPDSTVGKKVTILCPNPCKDYITILRQGDTLLEEQTVRIYKMSGECVKEDIIESGVASKKYLLNLTNGMYICQIISKKKTVDAQKIIVVSE